MTKLERLIEELCQDGVDYKKLNTICDIYDGTHQTPNYVECGVKFASVENIQNPYKTNIAQTTISILYRTPLPVLPPEPDKPVIYTSSSNIKN